MCNLGQNTTVAYNSLGGVAGDSGEGPTSLPISSLMRECQQSSPAVLTFLADDSCLVWRTLLSNSGHRISGRSLQGFTARRIGGRSSQGEWDGGSFLGAG